MVRKQGGTAAGLVGISSMLVYQVKGLDMIERMIGAAMLKASVFEEIEADRSALGQAILVVVLVTICGVVGGVLSDIIGGEGQSLGILLGILNGLLFGIGRWLLWVTLLWFVGSKMVPESGTQTDWAEMGRIVGFAYTPGILTILSFVPGVGGALSFIAFAWTLVAVVVGIKHALDYESIGRAILVAAITAVIGFIPWLILKVIEWIVTS